MSVRTSVIHSAGGSLDREWTVRTHIQYIHIQVVITSLVRVVQCISASHTHTD